MRFSEESRVCARSQLTRTTTAAPSTTLAEEEEQGTADEPPSADHDDSTLATSSTAFILDDMSSEDEEEQDVLSDADNNNTATDTEKVACSQEDVSVSPPRSPSRDPPADVSPPLDAGEQDGPSATTASGADSVGSQGGQASGLHATSALPQATYDADTSAHSLFGLSPPAPPAKQTMVELPFQASEEAIASPTIIAQSQTDTSMASAVGEGITKSDADMTVCFERLEGEAGSPCPDIRPSTPSQQVLPSQQPIPELTRHTTPIVRMASQPETSTARMTLEALDPMMGQQEQEQTTRCEPQEHACKPSLLCLVDTCASASPLLRDAANSAAVADSPVINHGSPRQDSAVFINPASVLPAMDGPLSDKAEAPTADLPMAPSYLGNAAAVGSDDDAVPAEGHTVVQPATILLSPQRQRDFAEEAARPTLALTSSSTDEPQAGDFTAAEEHEVAEASSEPHVSPRDPLEHDQSVELGRCQPALVDASPTPSCIDAVQPTSGAADISLTVARGVPEPAVLEPISPFNIPAGTPSPVRTAQCPASAGRGTPGLVTNVQDAPAIKWRILARREASPGRSDAVSETSHTLPPVQRSDLFRPHGSPTLRTGTAPPQPTRRSARTLARVASTESIATQEVTHGVKRNRTNCMAGADDGSAQLTPPTRDASSEVPAKRHSKRVAVLADESKPEATRNGRMSEVGRPRTRAVRSGIPTAAVPRAAKPRALPTNNARVATSAESVSAVRQNAKGKGREQRQASQHADEGLSSDESEAAVLVQQTARSPQRSGPAARASRSMRAGPGTRKATRQPPVAQSPTRLSTLASAGTLGADSGSGPPASSARVQLRSPQRVPLPTSPKKRNDRDHASARSPLKSSSSVAGSAVLWPNIAHMPKSASSIRGPLSPDGSKRVSIGCPLDGCLEGAPADVIHSSDRSCCFRWACSCTNANHPGWTELSNPCDALRCAGCICR